MRSDEGEKVIGSQDFQLTVVSDAEYLCSRTHHKRAGSSEYDPGGALHINLLDLEKPEFDGRLVETELMLAGVGCTYGVPASYFIYCECVDRCLYQCPLRVYNGQMMVISKTERVLLSLYNQNDFQIAALLKRHAGACSKAQVEINNRYSPQEYLALPGAIELRDGGAHRSISVFHVGVVDREDGYYTAIGRVVTEPKRQRKTLLIGEMQHQQEDWRKFRLTDEIRERFCVFQSEGSVHDRIWNIARDVTSNITRIFGKHRQRVLIAELLTLHSPLRYIFDGQDKPGWLGILKIGDTGQGKTTMTRSLLNSLDIGYFVDGALATRAGLLYSLDEKVAGKRFLRWGAFPLAHGQIIAVDEAHKISKQDWAQLTQVRSSGEVVVSRSLSGIHPAQVRLIFIGNPPGNESISGYLNGIEAVKDMIRPEDLRRLDLVCMMSDSDQDVEEVNRLSRDREDIPQVFTPELLRASVFWAWNLRPEQIEWADRAEELVINVSKSLVKKFGLTREFPLLLSSDAKDKVSKLAAAAGIMTHSTIDHKKVAITREHVDFAGTFIEDVYSHENCRLDRYIAAATEKVQLSDSHYHQINKSLEEMRNASLDSQSLDIILNAFRSAGVVTRKELMKGTGLSAPSISKKMNEFRNLNLVRTGARGYTRTPIFVQYLRRIEEGNGLSELTDLTD